MNTQVPGHEMMRNLEHVYIAIWTQMFNSILGWSEQEVLIWAEKYSEYLKDPDDIFFHEDPPYWAATALIPDHLGRVLSADQRSRLRNKILTILPCEKYLLSYLAVDWKRYKGQIEVLIAEYAN